MISQLKIGGAAFLVIALALHVGAGEVEWQPLELDQKWSFVGGDWQRDAQGVLTAPGSMAEQNLAFHTGSAYGDLEAEFEFRWDSIWTHAGFIFRASDPRHYYMVFFPTVGQQYRAEHFWGAIAKVDETGYVKVLNLEMVHGVTSSPTIWHKSRVQVRGNDIQVWVDGRSMRAVIDKTYARPGYVGLATATNIGAPEMSSFRNLRIRGRAAQAPKFDTAKLPRVNYGVAVHGTGAGSGNLVRLKNGDIVFVSGEQVVDRDAVLRRSSDGGRTWKAGLSLPKNQSTGLLRVTRGGTLESYAFTHKPPFVLSKAESMDSGQSWSKPQAVSELQFPKDVSFQAFYENRLLETRQGVLLLFGYARTKDEEHANIQRGRWHPPSCTPPIGWNVCLRSTDGGQTWSSPINIDGPPYDDKRWMIHKEASEISVTQTADGKLLALVRPFFSPFMWEGWSEDDGQTWTPLARGPFPMYACNNSMITTSSGALIIGGRFPGMGVQVSHDGGMSWKCFQVDTAAWSNGAMLEVEPNVVLWIYGGRNKPRQLRAQRIRVTDDGIEPADKEMK
ncbi:MAG: DUF1080 domain-containing protein [Acidobacteria bacterium]|nr:DUF1080 domain-containing protein [Acidobacteriota bacterium]